MKSVEKIFKSDELQAIRVYRRSGPVLGAVAGYLLLGLGGGIAGGAIADNGRADLNNALNIFGGFVIGTSAGSIAGGIGGAFAGKSMATKFRNKNIPGTNFREVRKEIAPFVAEQY